MPLTQPSSAKVEAPSALKKSLEPLAVAPNITQPLRPPGPPRRQ